MAITMLERAPLPDAGRRAMVIFNVGALYCALAREDVREILPLAHLWRPPGAPSLMAGMLNLGGQPLPVLSLAALFDIAGEDDSDPYRHILLTRASLRFDAVGLLAGRVQDVAYIGDTRLRAVDDERTLNGCVAAEFDWTDGALVHLLDLNRLLLDEERARLEEMRRTAQERLSQWAAP